MLQGLIMLCWSKWGSNSSTSAVEQEQRGPRLSIVEVSWTDRLKTEKTFSASMRLRTRNLQHGRPEDPVISPSRLQVRSVSLTPTVWSIRPWWASRQQGAAAKLWPSVFCSTYWELVHTSRGDWVSPTNWSRGLPRQLLTLSTWVSVSNIIYEIVYTPFEETITTHLYFFLF